jgi:hypothetical protein
MQQKLIAAAMVGIGLLGPAAIWADRRDTANYPYLPYDHAAIDYAGPAAENPVARLQAGLEHGEAKLAFDASLFSPNPIGTLGNSARRALYGPGMENCDMALHKVTRLVESRLLEIRFEAFNAFNHA